MVSETPTKIPLFCTAHAVETQRERAPGPCVSVFSRVLKPFVFNLSSLMTGNWGACLIRVLHVLLYLCADERNSGNVGLCVRVHAGCVAACWPAWAYVHCRKVRSPVNTVQQFN